MSGSVFLIIPYHPWCWQGGVGYRYISLLAPEYLLIRGCLCPQIARKEAEWLQRKRGKRVSHLPASGLSKKSLCHSDHLTRGGLIT